MSTPVPVYTDFRDCLDRPIRKGDVALVRENEVAPVIVGVVTGCYEPYVGDDGTVYAPAHITIHKSDGKYIDAAPYKVLVIAPGAINKLAPTSED